MPFTDHKIASFTHRIADLPDEPNLSAAELKARFDSAPEQLRQAHNAACDAAARLDERVEQQTTHLSERITQLSLEKFPDDTIEERHLHTDLAEKLNGKAEQTALAAEQTAREKADAALDRRTTQIEKEMPEKLGVYTGIYSGDNRETRTFTLGFRPKFVLSICITTYISNARIAGCCWAASRSHSSKAITINQDGFTLSSQSTSMVNDAGRDYMYFAFR